MSRALEPLALFPLETVLFPYSKLQLHIFEQRFQSLVGECLELGRPFGIVLIRSTGPQGEEEACMVGTQVRITSVHRYDDGRMDIEVVGERRFRVRRFEYTRPFPIGYVESIEESETKDTPRRDALVSRAREAFVELIRRAFSTQDVSVRIVVPEDATTLSFLIANALPMENREKQRMLELTDTLERLKGLIPLLDEQMDTVAVNQDEMLEAMSLRLSRPSLDRWISPN